MLVKVGLTALVVAFAVGLVLYIVMGSDKKSTDPQAVQQIREALAAQPPRPATVTLLNYRRPDASGHAQPFYNCLHIAPLRDAGASAVGQAPPSRGGIAWALRGMQEVCVRGLRVFLCFGGV